MYGKEPEQLANTAKLFRIVLEDFTIDQISRAFIVHVKRSNEMPRPAEIVGLILRNGRPPRDAATYVQLAQKRERTKFVANGRTHDCLTLAEEAYMREYEEFQING